MKYFLLLFAFQPFLLSAQIKVIKGTVQNNKEKLIQGVSITLEQTSYGTISDDSGAFEIRHLENKEYSLITSAIGFQPVRKKLIFITVMRFIWI